MRTIQVTPEIERLINKATEAEGMYEEAYFNAARSSDDESDQRRADACRNAMFHRGRLAAALMAAVGVHNWVIPPPRPSTVPSKF